MDTLLHLGEVLRTHARVKPEAIGARDLVRAMTFREWNARACQLANALHGVKRGHRVLRDKTDPPAAQFASLRFGHRAYVLPVEPHRPLGHAPADQRQHAHGGHGGQ